MSADQILIDDQGWKIHCNVAQKFNAAILIEKHAYDGADTICESF